QSALRLSWRKSGTGVESAGVWLRSTPSFANAPKIELRSSTSETWAVSNGGGRSEGSTSQVRSWTNLLDQRARSASDITACAVPRWPCRAAQHKAHIARADRFSRHLQSPVQQND